MSLSRNNNFDLIRLVAVLDVAIDHIFGGENIFCKIIPGVPIFFFVSGFLVYGSYEKSILSSQYPNFNFFVKRFLRIYPALIICTLLTILSVWQNGYFNSINISFKDFTTWFLGQVTFLQFYSPHFWSGYGLGNPNGCLWTISTEIQFYLLTPIIFFIANRFSKLKFILFISFFLILNLFNIHFNDRSNYFLKLFFYSSPPWIYMFLIGCFIYKSKNLINLINKIPYFIIFSLFIFTYISSKDIGWGDSLNPIGFIILVLLVLKSAYTFPSLSDRILKRNDFTYGIYMYHIPIINYLLYLNFKSSELSFYIYASILTLIFAILSWKIIEKPLLSFKKNILQGIS